MSTLSLNLTPGYLFSDGEQLTYAKLRALATPAVNLEGAIGSIQIGAGAVGTDQLADGAVIAGKCAVGGFTADGTGVGPFAAGFLAALMAAQNAAPTLAMTNCVAQNNLASPTTKVDIAAAEVALKNSTGGVYLATAVSLTVDRGASGANGLDTGSVTASTWYYVWLIYNGSTLAGLLSTSATAPTLPAGYTFQALVAAVYNTTGNNFYSFATQNRRTYLAAGQLATAAAMTSYASFAAFTTNLALWVPPNAKVAFGRSTPSTGTVQVAGNAAGVGADAYVANTAWQVPLIAAQTLYLKASSTSATLNLTVDGFEF